MEIKLVKVMPNDVTYLSELAIKTYQQSIYGLINHTDVDKYATENYAPKKLLEQLQNDHTEFFFAKSGDEIYGFVKYYYTEDYLEVDKLYLLDNAKHRGIGTFIIHDAELNAQNRHLNRIILSVIDINKLAQSFYTKNGFTEYEQDKINIGTERHTLHLLEKLVR